MCQRDVMSVTKMRIIHRPPTGVSVRVNARPGSTAGQRAQRNSHGKLQEQGIGDDGKGGAKGAHRPWSRHRVKGSAKSAK
jgi:hypothetical protein